MIELLKLVLSDIGITTFFCIAMVLMMFADTILGGLLANKKDEFSIKRLFDGVIRNVLFIIGIDLAVASISGILNGLIVFHIDLLSPEVLEKVNLATIITLIVTVTIMTYGKSVVEKFKLYTK